jgi:DNA-directed RNA polymerase subunit RPC12/RpoP
MNSRLVVILILFGLPVSCKQDYNHTSNPDKEYTVEELTGDLKYLKNVLEINHPTLFDPFRKMIYTELYDSLYKSLNQPMSLRDFFMMLAPLTASLDCGHTHISFPEGYWEKMNEEYTYLPFKIFFKKNKAYIRHNFSNQKKIPEGAELIEINGIPVHEFIFNLLRIIPSDNNMTAYKYHCMNELEFGLFPGYNNFPDSYNIKYRLNHEDSIQKTADIKALSRDEIIKNMNALKIQNSNYESYSFKLLENMNIPVITIKEFAGYDNKNYESFLKQTFAQINGNKADNLIIDVRGNDGGDPLFAAELITYIIPSEVRYFSHDVYGYNNLKKPLAPKENNFKGSVYVLMDGGCFSTTGHFLSVLKYNKTAVLIGEESGGNWICNGCYKEFILPYTKLKVLCPRCVYKTSVKGMRHDRGIFPDIYVEKNITDILENRDKALEVCLDIIRKTSNGVD